MLLALWLALACGLARADGPAPAPEATPEAIALASDAPGQVKPDDPYWDLELLYFEQRIDEGLAAARARLAAAPGDPELHWHVARFLFEIGEQHARDDASFDKIALYREMQAVSEAGLALAPDHAHLHFALGIALGRLGTTRGVLKSLFLAKDVEQAWLRAATSGYAYRSINGGEQLPCDAQQTLGIFYRIVPDWWIVKVLAGTRGDLDASLRWLEEANRCSPGDIGIVKELGVTQLCIATTRDEAEMLERGRATLRGALRIPAREASTDRIDHDHIRRLVEDPSLACEYSRDGQQELDRAALEGAEAAP